MLTYTRLMTTLFALGLILALTAASATAAVYVKEDRYSLQASDTLDDDLYLMCGGAMFWVDVESTSSGVRGGALIDGVITEDLWIAGGRYDMAGIVLGNLNTATQLATISGHVENSARIFAQRVTFDGSTGNNLMIFASEIELGRGCRIGNDIALFGGEISVSGDIGGGVVLRGDQVIISGKITGDLDIEANSISIVTPSEIGGNITYRSKREIKIDDDVIVGGDVDWEEVTDDEDDDGDGANWGTKVVLFFCSLVTGLILIPVFNRHTHMTVRQITDNFVPSLGIGFVFLIVAPIAILLLLITVIGIPAGMMLLFAYTVFFYISKIYVSIALGHIIVRAFRKGVKPKQGIALVLGLITLSLLFTIPYIGWIVYLVTLFIGVGGLLRGLQECRRHVADSEAPVTDAAH